jgi:hypothetical protein
MDLVTCEDGHRKVAYEDIGGGGEQLQCPVCEVLEALREAEVDHEAAVDELEDKIKELENR